MTPVYLILSLAETLIQFQILNAFLQRNARPNSDYGLGLFFYFLFQFITYDGEWPLFSASIHYVLFTFLLAFMFYKDTLQVKVLLSYLFVTLHYSCKLASTLFFTWFKHNRLPARPAELVQSPLSQITACILFMAFTWLFIAFRKMRRQNKYALYSAITCIAPICVLFIVISQFSLRNNNHISSFYLSEAGILICTAFTLFYLIDKTEIIDEESQKSAMASRLLTMQKNYYKNMEKSQSQVASMRHDLKNHLLCISSLLQLEKYEDARSYIDELCADALRLSVAVDMGHQLISILLNNARETAAQEDIHFHANVMVPKDLPIDNVDLCVILSNLLDNAMEACCRIPEGTRRFADVEILYKKSFLFLKLSNSYDGTCIVHDERYESVKKDRRFSGIGLSNVRATIEKYNGEMKISHDDSVFTVTVMLQLPDTVRFDKEKRNAKSVPKSFSGTPKQ